MNKFIIILSVALICLSSCSKEEININGSDIIGLGGDEYQETVIDKWLYDNFVKTYNMEIKYKFNRFELDLNKMLVPVKEEVVLPIMDIVKSIWITPYETLAGTTFIKSLAPKNFVLVGSPQYNGETITLGEAEGGKKIVIFRLNWFKPNASSTSDIQAKNELIQSMMKTVHHEFVHTMHQIKMYPEEFMKITPGGYTAQWNNVNDLDALKLGYISSYACSNPNEDLAETISRIVVYGRKTFDNRVNQATAIYNDPKQNAGMTYDPGKALKEKEAMVVSYLKEVWGVPLYDIPGSKGLETLVQEEIAKYVK